MNDDWKSKLLGKTIATIEVAGDNDVLRFVFGDGSNLSLFAYGDCCSKSWFNDILNVPALIGGTVREIAELEMPDPPDAPDSPDEEGTYLEFYGYKITTDKGDATLAFRNASNGYYSGSIVEVTPPGYGYHVPETWTQITSDWSA